MRLRKNKKGMAGMLIFMTFMVFFFAIFSLISLFMWDQFDGAIQSLGNDTLNENVKNQISEYRAKMVFGDRLFVFFFICLLIAYLISAVTTPVQNPYYMIVFAVVLILTTLLSMLLSNGWQYITESPGFEVAAADHGITNHIMKFFPIYTFFIGIIGAVLYFGRKTTTFSEGGGSSVLE